MREISERFGLAVDPEGASRGHHGRAAAAGRDPQGALPQRRHPRARRADRGSDAAGGGRAVRDHPRSHRAGEVDHLHQPQAERGDRGRRPDHRAAPREDDRDAAGGGRDGAEPRAADGRPRGAAARRQGPVAPERHAARGRGSARLRRSRDREGARPLARGPGGRDRRSRRDRRQRADGADRRDDGPAQGRPSGTVTVAGDDVTTDERLGHFDGGPRSHPGGPAAARPRARVLDRREHRPARLPPAARLEIRLAVPGSPASSAARG